MIVSSFTVDTYVQFDKGQRVTRAILEQRTKDMKAGFILALDEQRIREILNCAIASDDVPGWLVKDIKLAKETRSARAKAKQTPTPMPFAPKVSAAIESLRVRFEKRCAACRFAFTEIIGIVDLDWPRSSGSKNEPDRFVSDAEAAFELLDEEQPCEECLN